MLIVPFVVIITWSGAYGSRPWANVLACEWDEDGTSNRNDHLIDLADNALNAWVDNIKPVISEHVSLTNIRVQDIDSADGAIYEASQAQAGASSAQGMSPGTSILVSKVTAHNRSQRNGRWFQNGGLESYTTAAAPDVLDAGPLGLMQAAFVGFGNDMQGDADGQPVRPCVLSKNGADIQPAVIQEWTVEAELATQRRRQRK